MTTDSGPAAVRTSGDRREPRRALVLSGAHEWGNRVRSGLEARGYMAWLVPSAGRMLSDLVRERYHLVVLDAREGPESWQAFVNDLRKPPWGPPCLLRLPDRFRLEWRGLGLDLGSSASDDLSNLEEVLMESEVAARQIATLTEDQAALVRGPGVKPAAGPGPPGGAGPESGS